MAPPTAAKRSHAAISKGGQNKIESPQQWTEPIMSIEAFDCSKYDYMPDESGGFWQLQPDYATEELPRTIPRIATSMSPNLKTQDIAFPCLVGPCQAPPFQREADLERHYKQVHGDNQTQPSPALSLKDSTPATSVSNPSPKVTTKGKPAAKANSKAAGGGNRNNSVAGASGKKDDDIFSCDYLSCNRKNEPFSRKDRLRIHYVDVHKEDVNKKGGDITEDWLQTRKAYPAWWRCTKCLSRVKVEDNGWECPKDGTKCEDKRREFRKKLQNM
ncbi:hypothetical protein CkaCkLH20_02491 [Colletotrichum karsti]|uniref:C2H2-type domain-containing protein n=1 Tax=Colletotrichum karsti TaxID=1095194 RepID=A0A9P6IBP4_9PEZI|nr:uncharacterized protein CkaCkLH20_02491 [Colletotrichum karsti]KAF9879680.1 hypothetical protein CkaCkLH20_02491 [Colletotrichum karsti]